MFLIRHLFFLLPSKLGLYCWNEVVFLSRTALNSGCCQVFVFMLNVSSHNIQPLCQKGLQPTLFPPSISSSWHPLMEHVGKSALSCASLFLFIFYFLFIFLVLIYFGNGHRRKVVDLLIYMILVYSQTSLRRFKIVFSYNNFKFSTSLSAWRNS